MFRKEALILPFIPGPFVLILKDKMVPALGMVPGEFGDSVLGASVWFWFGKSMWVRGIG